MKTDEMTRVLQGRMEFDVSLFGPEELRLIERVNQAGGDKAHGPVAGRIELTPQRLRSASWQSGDNSAAARLKFP